MLNQTAYLLPETLIPNGNSQDSSIQKDREKKWNLYYCKLTVSINWNTGNQSAPTKINEKIGHHNAICSILQWSSLLCNFFFLSK